MSCLQWGGKSSPAAYDPIQLLTSAVRDLLQLLDSAVHDQLQPLQPPPSLTLCGASLLNSTLETKPLPIPKRLHHSLTISNPAGSGLRAALFEAAFAAPRFRRGVRQTEDVDIPVSPEALEEFHNAAAYSKRFKNKSMDLWDTMVSFGILGGGTMIPKLKVVGTLPGSNGGFRAVLAEMSMAYLERVEDKDFGDVRSGKDAD